MTAFNARLQLCRTDQEILKALVFNFDTGQEIQEFKDLVIQAHLAVVNKPVHQVPVVSILNNADFRECNAAVGITGDEMGDL